MKIKFCGRYKVSIIDTMNRGSDISTRSLRYYRLIALWVLSEAMLGGVIHGLKIPVSGLVVGSAAVLCICLIAWYAPAGGAILKATVIVAVFKMMLSPQAPPTAYIAVFFQGLLGELLLSNKKYFRLSCLLFAVLALLESGLQRIAVLTIIYGNDLWKVINDFINGLTKQKMTANYSLLIGGGYVLLHVTAGIITGCWASLLPGLISKWSQQKIYSLPVPGTTESIVTMAVKKKKRWKKGIFIAWFVLLVVYIQSYYKTGTPLLPAHISLKILVRSFLIVLGWYFIIGPFVKKILQRWLQQKQTRVQAEINQVLELLPATQQLVLQSWNRVLQYRGWKRFKTVIKIILVNALDPARGKKIVIVSGPVQTGKTTALVNWSAGRNDVHGILTPVANEKRVFMNIASRHLFRMEAREEDESVWVVGKHIFSTEHFEKAITIIKEAVHKEGWLVIDEIGPLELRGNGFHDVLKEALEQRHDKILLVVREGLEEKVINHFQLPGPVCISPQQVAALV